MNKVYAFFLQKYAKKTIKLHQQFTFRYSKKNIRKTARYIEVIVIKFASEFTSGALCIDHVPAKNTIAFDCTRMILSALLSYLTTSSKLLETLC